jgi:peptidase M28-like protein
MRSRRFLLSIVLASTLAAGLTAQTASKVGVNSIQEGPLREWLTYLSSDLLQGRATYSEGLGLAAAYIADRLKEFGVKPAGDDGSYFQVVKVLGVRTTSRASVTVEVNGQTRTFKDGQGITFPRNMGGKQTVVADRVLFAGYGLSLPSLKHDDYASVDAKGAAVIWLGNGPRLQGVETRRLLSSRARTAFDKGAIATLGPVGAGGGRGRGGRGGQPSETETSNTVEQQPAGDRGQGQGAGRGQGGGRGVVDDGDFTTVQRLDNKIPPSVTGQDEFFEFLFSGSDVTYADLKQRATSQQTLAPFVLKGVKLTFQVDADYDVVRTRYTRNVVGIVEGTDPSLKKTYVLYGAHYDHTGYREGAPRAGRDDGEDRINNGADDDGSGTVAILSVARAFAMGPKPKRSILFVWHAGEESGLLGSRYNADYPVVPIDSMVALINIDMVGRNRDDDPKQANTGWSLDRIASAPSCTTSTRTRTPRCRSL